MREVLQLNLLLLLLSVFNSSEGGISAAQRIALPGCPDRCGDKEIPYPFGIGRGCYDDSPFEIVCKKSSNVSKPFLKVLDNEVMDIKISGGPSALNLSRIRVRAGKIFSTGCNRRRQESSLLLNLTGLPFYYAGFNHVVAVGCNTSVSLIHRDSRNNLQQFGCGSTCDLSEFLDKDERENGCNGFKCCTVTIGYEIAFNVTLDSNNSTDCKFALLTDELWLPSNATQANIPRQEYMPITMSWYAFPSFNGQTGVSFTCENTTFIGKNLTTCWCKKGFRGNPYLPNACEDIDECQESRDNHQKLCGENKCENTLGAYVCHDKKTWQLILGLSLGFGLLLVVGGGWALHEHMERKKVLEQKKKNFERNGGVLLHEKLCSIEGRVDNIRVFSARELEVATDKFNENRILGQGGQGTIYKGILPNGSLVAIKKARVIDEENLEEFFNELIILSQISHRNVVRILGCCVELEVPTLVYEFIANGNLSQHLHLVPGRSFLSWDDRLCIASETAHALSHLHSSASIPIYHRDIKSTNILLDEKLRAKVSDFGISRTITIDQTHLTTIISGTFGYLDPEYLQSSRFTDKSDVYSFGVVLLELLTGEKPISDIRPDETKLLSTYFILSMQENRLSGVVDREILDQCNEEEVVEIARLAKNCLNSKGKKRPTMKEVAHKLEKIWSERIKFNNQHQVVGEFQTCVFNREMFSSPLDCNSRECLSDTSLLANYKTW